MFNKAIVIGSPGSGKSTFARKLKDMTGLPLYHLDMIWHKPDKTNITRDEFDVKLIRILNQDKWIIDGNYQRTIGLRLEYCDTVFLLDYPVDVCLQGVRSRLGKKRSDMPWFETELDDEFKQFIIGYPENELPMIYNMLKSYQDKQIIVFNSREQADEYISKLSKYK
ncbi:MAG: adenylate kinase [Ruminococcus sp.]|nr:adenylate kinase [Ruminococcus sp.]